MILRPHEWQEVWNVIESERLDSNEKSLAVIFSQQEVETVCAVNMIQKGLNTKGVNYAKYPVDNHTELRSILEKLLDNSEEMRTVMILNCGASHYIKNVAPKSAVNVRYVVIDSHRPVHPAYNDEHDRDVLFMLAEDDPLQLDEIPVSNEKLDNFPEEVKQDLMDKAQQEAIDEENEDEESPAKRARMDGEGGRDKRFYRDKLRVLRDREKLVNAYYDMGSSYGKPTPLLLQPLVEMLMGKADNSIFWPAVVGLVDQWVHQRLSRQHYDRWYAALKEKVLSHDTNRGVVVNHSAGALPPQSQPVVVADRDYRLMLPRHWGLYDSFVFSSYVAPRLQTWRSAGQDIVQLIFANMGIPVEQAKTRYDSMQASRRKAFHEKLPAALANTRLVYDELACEGFALLHSRKMTLASDMVHACTALLSEPMLYETVQQNPSRAKEAFWNAVDAIDAWTIQGYPHLVHGIEMAKLMQQAIIMDGGLLVTDRKLQTNAAAHMQELFLHLVPPTNAREFRHPLTLLRLAQFVRDATKVARQATRLKTCNYPIMVVGPEDTDGFCLAIGLRANPLPDKAQYNIFGHTFRSVLADPDSSTQWDKDRDAFDSAVVYVHKSSVQNFNMDVRTILRNQVLADEEASQRAKQQTQQQQQQQQEQQQWPSDEDAAGGPGSRDSSGGSDGSKRRRGDHPPEGPSDGDGESSLAATAVDSGDEGDYADVVAASDDEGEQEGPGGIDEEAEEGDGDE